MSLTRVAPTPSGYLHTGNLVNFALTASVARHLDLSLALRIDDIDQARVRPQYVDDVFRALAWLRIEFQVGPVDRGDLENRFSQTHRLDRYWAALQAMAGQGMPVFPCRCSRTALQDGRCVAGCGSEHSGAALADAPGASRVRWRAATEDVTLWGHDGRPTYHLANVVDDADLATTHVVRGLDLEPSTHLHVAMARFLPGAGVIRYAHHPLLLDASGSKLSKSQGTARLELTDDLARDVRAHAASLLPDVLTQLTG